MSRPVLDFYAGLRDRQEELNEPFPKHLIPVLRFGTYTQYKDYPMELPPPAPPLDKDCTILLYGFEITREMISKWEEKNSEKIVETDADSSLLIIRRLMGFVCDRVGLGEGPTYRKSFTQERRETSPCKNDVVYFASVSKGRESLRWSPSKELLSKVAEELGAEGPQWIRA